MHRRWMHWTSLATLVAFLSVVLSEGRARAQTPPAAVEGVDNKTAAAQGHFQAGKDAFAAGDFSVAIREWKAAQALKESPKLDYNIGLAYERLGRPRAAIKYYRRYLEALPTASNRVEVEQRINALAARVPGDDLGEAVPPAPPPGTPRTDGTGALPGGPGAPVPGPGPGSTPVPPGDPGPMMGASGQTPPPVYYYGSPPPAPVMPPPPAKRSSNWWIVFPIVGGVLLTIFFVYLLTLSTTTVDTRTDFLRPLPDGDGVPPLEPALLRF